MSVLPLGPRVEVRGTPLDGCSIALTKVLLGLASEQVWTTVEVEGIGLNGLSCVFPLDFTCTFMKYTKIF